jgi:hypothetical protein
MHDDLKDLLCAWYVSRLDEGQEYVSPVVCPIIRFSLTKTLFQVSDIHHLAGMLVITMPLPQAFIALRNLLNRPCLRAFYSGFTEEVEAYYRVSRRLAGECGSDSFPIFSRSSRTCKANYSPRYMPIANTSASDYHHHISQPSSSTNWHSKPQQGSGTSSCWKATVIFSEQRWQYSPF